MAKLNFEKLIKKINVYPPYLSMGIRVKSVSDDYTRFEVVLRQRWYNRNLFGTHFGGCLYSMCDPFYSARKSMYGPGTGHERGI